MTDKPPHGNRALMMYRTACTFYEAGRLISAGIRPDFGMLQVPTHVNAAFAAELFLKCIILGERGTFEQTHQLERLFNALEPDTQTQVTAYYDRWLDESEIPLAFSVAYQRDVGIRGMLRDCGDTFVKLRYFFDQP